jgi:uncharacterized protein (TIGR00725 family)
MPQGQRIITIFGSGRVHAGDADYEEARVLGGELAQQGFAICSGGYGGVMEAASRGAREAGGKVIGITSKYFQNSPNKWVDEVSEMKTWDERLFELIRVGDGYVACKGGTGTMAELAVLWEMLNKGIITGKPLVILGDFWKPVVERVREVEFGGRWREGQPGAPLLHFSADGRETAEIFTRIFAAISR